MKSMASAQQQQQWHDKQFKVQLRNNNENAKLNDNNNDYSREIKLVNIIFGICKQNATKTMTMRTNEKNLMGERERDGERKKHTLTNKQCKPVKGIWRQEAQIIKGKLCAHCTKA